MQIISNEQHQPEKTDDLIRVQNAIFFYEALRDDSQIALFEKWNIANKKVMSDNDIMIALRWQLKMAIRKICIERGTWNYKFKIPSFSEGTLPFET